MRVGSRQRLAREEHLIRDARPGQARQEPAHATIGREADVDERLEQIGLWRCDADVAGQRVARTDADRRAVHRRDHWLRHGAQACEHRHVLVAQHVAVVLRRPHSRALHHLVDIRAGAERTPRTGEDQHADGIVALRLLDRLTQLLARQRADCVHLLGPVELNQPFAILNASGAFCASCRATRFATSIVISAGTTLLTMPSSRARSAVTGAPVRTVSMAAYLPAVRGHRCVPPAPGMMPRLISGWPKRAESPAMIMSHISASSHPPPSA